mgnify:CR=1|jgi:hypothetical protein
MIDATLSYPLTFRSPNVQKIQENDKPRFTQPLHGRTVSSGALLELQFY